MEKKKVANVSNKLQMLKEDIHQ